MRINQQLSVYRHISIYLHLKREEASLLQVEEKWGTISRPFPTVKGFSQTWKSIKGLAPICEDEEGLIKNEVENESLCDDDEYCIIGEEESGIYTEWMYLTEGEIFQAQVCENYSTLEEEKSHIDDESINVIDTNTIDNYVNDQINSTIDEKSSSPQLNQADSKRTDAATYPLLQSNEYEALDLKTDKCVRSNVHGSENDEYVLQSGNESYSDPGKQSPEQECNSDLSEESTPGSKASFIPNGKGKSSDYCRT